VRVSSKSLWKSLPTCTITAEERGVNVGPRRGLEPSERVFCAGRDSLERLEDPRRDCTGVSAGDDGIVWDNEKRGGSVGLSDRIDRSSERERGEKLEELLLLGGGS